MSLAIRVQEVCPIGDMVLSVKFENGVTKKYDVRQLLPQFPIYADLSRYGIFDNVRVDSGGCGISWNDEIDISECELWENGK